MNSQPLPFDWMYSYADEFSTLSFELTESYADEFSTPSIWLDIQFGVFCKNDYEFAYIVN